MCCEDKDSKPEEMEHFYEFIYQNFHKPSLIHRHKPYNQHRPPAPHTHTQALEKAVKYFEGQEGRNAAQ